MYFCRADQFEDTYEGAKGRKRRKEVWDSDYLQFFRDAIRHPPPGYELQKTDAEIEEDAKRLLSDLEVGGEASRTSTFINCWHENDHESVAMWRLYSSFLPNAIAVRSSYGGLYRALGRNPSIKIGRVRYLDLNKQYAGINDAFWRKRQSFEHEREVRAILMDFQSHELGRFVPCDVEILIQQVFVSPKAPDWFVDIVNDVNEKFGIKITVSGSGLTEEPFF